MKLCPYNSLIPALYFNATVNHDLMIGPTSPGPIMMYGGVRTGVFRSEPNFPVKLNGEVLYTGDVVTVDPDQKYLRNNIQGIIKTEEGDHIQLSAYAVEEPTPAVMAILGSVANAPDVEFGDFYGVSTWKFSTGNAKYKELENAIYVGSTRLSLGSEPDSFSIAFKISQVRHTASAECVEVADEKTHTEL